MKQREENSGLIDLDALLKQAATPGRTSSPAPAMAVTPAPAPAPKAAPAPAPARAVAAAVVHAPAPAVRAVRAVADDSLDGLAAAPSSSTVAAALASLEVERVPSVTASSHVPSVPVSTSTSSSSSGVAQSASATPSRRRRYGIAAGVAAAALAALVVVRIAHAPSASPAVAAHPAAPAVAAPVAQPVAAPAATVAAVDPNALDPNALPTAVDVKAAPAAAPRVPLGLGRSALVAPKAEATAAAPEGPAKITETDLAAVAGKDPGDLGNAMQSAVGPRAEEKGTAEVSANNGARQLRPSPGAVVGAINSVLPAARACLGPDDAVRNGSLVFRSDGSVASVDLRGSKDEDACVRSALSKAHVAAFADDTFTTRVTVRP